MADSQDNGEGVVGDDHDTGVHVRNEAESAAAGVVWQRVFARLTEQSDDVFIVLTSTSWRFRVIGGAVAKVLDCHVDELRNHPILDWVHPNDRVRLGRLLAEAQASPGKTFTVDYRWRARGGEYVDVRSTLAHQLDDPAIEGLVLTTRRHALPKPLADLDLPDRASFIAAVGRYPLDATDPFSVLVVEVADYRYLAAGLGHDHARKLVQYVGRRMRGAVNRADMVAQIGVDAFAVLLGGVREEGRIEAVASRLLDRLRAPFHVGGQELVIGVAVGFATSARPYQDAEEVLTAAEAAAHRASPSRPRAYHTPMRADVQRRLRLAAALPRAFERGEFQIRYQPIVRLDDESLTGFEALVRWMHPELGTIPPGEFIPLAEQLDWIVRLDRWMLEETSRRISGWPAGRPFRVSVNVSARHLDDPMLVPTVSTALSGAGLSPERLRIEITETAVANDAKRSIGALTRLKGLGISLAIDDFGTGYASLASLADMPFDVLKIDMSFTHKLAERQSRGVVQNIVTMAHDLGLEVVAEGVETREQLENLREMQCDCAQGYFFARPLPAGQALGWIGSPI